jgi:hypothetical protein
VVGIQPLQTLDPAINFKFFPRGSLILVEDLLVKPQHDEVDDLSHVVVHIEAQYIVLHQLLFYLLVELAKAIFYAGPVYIVLA